MPVRVGVSIVVCGPKRSGNERILGPRMDEKELNLLWKGKGPDSHLGGSGVVFRECYVQLDYKSSEPQVNIR
jgi:hypothetical protein